MSYCQAKSQHKEGDYPCQPYQYARKPAEEQRAQHDQGRIAGREHIKQRGQQMPDIEARRQEEPFIAQLVINQNLALVEVFIHV